MRVAFIPIAAAIFCRVAAAQQPVVVRPASPSAQPSAAGCPMIVVDGQIVSAADQCRPTPAAPSGPRPDWASPPPAADPLARFLYPPELVMAHQEALGLTDKQRSAIQNAVKDAQGKVVDIQFKMSAEVEKLQHLLQMFTPDEPSVLDEVGRVLTLERDMKLAQMTLMIRVKSQLTERQQGLLDQIRSSAPGYYLNGTQTPRPPEE